MPAIVHNVVRLQRAFMAIYNAWCDHTPVMVMGGTGPMNSSKRRTWIDWIHTAQVQGNLVRDFVKWDTNRWASRRFRPRSCAAIASP